MNCLVTKLNGVVQNELIPKIGERVIHFSKTKNSFSFANSDSTTLKLIGDECYFTDSTYSQNYGKNSEVDAYNGIRYKTFYVYAPKGADLIINVYNNKVLQLYDCEFDVTSLYFSSKNRNATIITDCQTPQVSLESLLKDRNISGVLELDCVYGDINAVKNQTNLTTCSLYSSGIYGDLSSLSNLNNLKILRLNKSKITGDLSKLPPSVYCTIFDSTISLSWDGERDSSSYIMAINDTPTINNVDKMLINQAKCKASPSGNATSTPWNFTISVKGTRTSASDSAVAELQSKGYTVSVTPIE